jgi:hypothetical protein
VYCKQTMNINTTSNGVQHQPMRSKPLLATHKRSITFRSKVLLERVPMRTSSRDESLMVEMFVNQNAILWKHIERYEQKISEFDQANKQYLINEKRLDNYKEQTFELEQQCKTLMKDSQKKNEETKNLSQGLILTQNNNSKLEAALRQQFQNQRSTMNHSTDDGNIVEDTIHLKQMCKIISQQQEQDNGNQNKNLKRKHSHGVKYMKVVPKVSKITKNNNTPKKRPVSKEKNGKAKTSSLLVALSSAAAAPTKQKC